MEGNFVHETKHKRNCTYFGSHGVRMQAENVVFFSIKILVPLFMQAEPKENERRNPQQFCHIQQHVLFLLCSSWDFSRHTDGQGFRNKQFFVFLCHYFRRCNEMARHPKSGSMGWGSQASASGWAGLVAGSLFLLPGASSFQFSPEMARHSSRLWVPCANWYLMWVEMRRHTQLSQKFGVSPHFTPPVTFQATMYSCECWSAALSFHGVLSLWPNMLVAEAAALMLSPRWSTLITDSLNLLISANQFPKANCTNSLSSGSTWKSGHVLRMHRVSEGIAFCGDESSGEKKKPSMLFSRWTRTWGGKFQ